MDDEMDVAELEPEAKKGKTVFRDGGPLDFQLSTSGLSLTGKTRSAKELTAFIEKLKALATLLPEDEDDSDAP